MHQLRLGLFAIVLALIGGFIGLGDCRDAAQKEAARDKLEKVETHTTRKDLFRNVRTHFKVPKMFEWQVFKEKYHKSYNSTLEDLVRMRRFLARSCEVIVKAVKYYNKQIGYFTTINERSDLLDEELEASRNKILAAENVKKLRRSKRDLSERESEETSSGFREKYAKQEGFKRLRATFTEEGNRRDYGELPVRSQYKTVSFASMLGRFFFGDWRHADAPKQQVHQQRPAEDDVVWVDHRRSGCLQPTVGSQGMCGSCYAFAMIAYVEWAHCQETGQLLKFSEQYLMDCGRMTSQQIDGCNGAATFACGEFMANFGLELAQTYPYLARSSVCPYGSRTPLHSMGHLRLAHLDAVLEVGLAVIEDYLEFAPMVIAIQCEGDFDFYGGGVFDGRECDRRRPGDHAVLLIGHGREDGEEYWLIRNSHGLSWGEQGHMKLNKNNHCIWPADGSVFGSTDVRSIKLGVAVNDNMSKPFNMIKSPLTFALRTVPIG